MPLSLQTMDKASFLGNCIFFFNIERKMPAFTSAKLVLRLHIILLDGFMLKKWIKAVLVLYSSKAVP